MTDKIRPNVIEITKDTNDWLQSVFPQIEGKEISLTLQYILCVALCCHLQRLDEPKKKKQIEQVLKGCDKFNVDDLLHSDSGLVLLSAIVQQAVMGKLFPNLREYAYKTSTILSEVVDEANLDSFYHARWLLHRLGYTSMPSKPKFNWPEHLPSFLRATPEQLRVFAEKVAAHTDYGTRIVEPPKGLCAVLQICAIHLMKKNYNFDLGGALLRHVAILGERESFAMLTAREFICENQNPLGGFGLLGMELDYLHKIDPCYSPLKLLIPYTLASLWTLAETDTEPYSFYDFSVNCGT